MMENKNTCLNDESKITPIPNHLVKGDKNTTLDEGEKPAVIPGTLGKYLFCVENKTKSTL